MLLISRMKIKMDSGLTRAILALALRAGFAVRARSCASVAGMTNFIQAVPSNLDCVREPAALRKVCRTPQPRDCFVPPTCLRRMSHFASAPRPTIR